MKCLMTSWKRQNREVLFVWVFFFSSIVSSPVSSKVKKEKRSGDTWMTIDCSNCTMTNAKRKKIPFLIRLKKENRIKLKLNFLPALWNLCLNVARFFFYFSLIFFNKTKNGKVKNEHQLYCCKLLSSSSFRINSFS